MPAEIFLVGQGITSSNYAHPDGKLFSFTLDRVIETARNFGVAGVTELEIPEPILSDDVSMGVGIDGLDAVAKALSQNGAKIVASYLSGPIGSDDAAYVKQNKTKIQALLGAFGDIVAFELHPAGKEYSSPDRIRRTVAIWDELAKFTAGIRPGTQLCFHNHYDSFGETAEQVRNYLTAIRESGNPNLRWGLDTGHAHGMKDQYLQTLNEFADLIGSYFHIKARIPRFDKGHEMAIPNGPYNQAADITGGNLYSGFVNPADPEVTTPFREVFDIIRANGTGIIRGALEIDNPRQHPALEAVLAVQYFREIHGIKVANEIGYNTMMRNLHALRIIGR